MVPRPRCSCAVQGGISATKSNLTIRPQQPVLLSSSVSDAVWITDALLAGAFARFCFRIHHGCNPGPGHTRRFASNVPGPLESRRRLGKRQMTELHQQLSPQLPAMSLPAWAAAADMRQWQWAKPRDEAERKAREAETRDVRDAQNAWAAVFPSLSVPKWLTAMGGSTTTDTSTATAQDVEQTHAADTTDTAPRHSASAQALFAELDAWEQDKSRDEELRYTAICSVFQTQLSLAALTADESLDVFDRLWHRRPRQQRRPEEDVMTAATLYAAVLDGVRSCRLLQPRDLGAAFWNRLLLRAADIVGTAATATATAGRLAAEILLAAPPEFVGQLDLDGTLPSLLAAALTSDLAPVPTRNSSSSSTSLILDSATRTSSKLDEQLAAARAACATGDLPSARAALTDAHGLHQQCCRTLWQADALLSADNAFATAMAAALHHVDPLVVVPATSSRLLQQQQQLQHMETQTRGDAGDVGAASSQYCYRWLLLLAHMPQVRQDCLFAALQLLTAANNNLNHSLSSSSSIALCRLFLAQWTSRGYLSQPAQLSFGMLMTSAAAGTAAATNNDIALAALALAVFRFKQSRPRSVALYLSLCRCLQLLGRDAPAELARSVEALAAASAASATMPAHLPAGFFKALAWAADDAHVALRLHAIHAVHAATHAADQTRSHPQSQSQSQSQSSSSFSSSSAWSLRFWDKFAGRLAAALDARTVTPTQVAYALDVPSASDGRKGKIKIKQRTAKTSGNTAATVQRPTVALVLRLVAHFALSPDLPHRQALRRVEQCRTFLHRHGDMPLLALPSSSSSFSSVLRAIFHLVTRDLADARPGRTTRLLWYLAAVEREHGTEAAITSARALARWRASAVQAGEKKRRAVELAELAELAKDRKGHQR